MTPENWQRVREVFERALDVEPARLEGWLREQPLEAGERAEVTSLLAHHSRAGSFLASPLPEQVPQLLDEQEPLAPGMVVGHYTIVREIGRGTMGRVYLADDGLLGRAVALKALPPHLSGDPAHRERLKREARAAAGLTHPGICAVYALEEFGGQLFIISEFVDGHTLRDEIAGRQPPTAAAIAATARELAEALATAHEKGIAHRDFKPENVMRDRNGRLKVLDFGLAMMTQPQALTDAAAGRAMLATLPGVLIGTPAYMAPEQLSGQPVDARADVFAYGVVVYEYACGSHPFEAPTPIGLLARVLESEAKPIVARTPNISSGVATVVDRCLRKAAADRFVSAAEIVSALTGGGEANVAGSAPPRAALAWWRAHQLIVMAVYVAATTIAWSIKEAFTSPLLLWLFIALGIGSSIAGVLRGHLLFTSLVNRPRLKTEHLRIRGNMTMVDVLIAVALAIDGLAIATARPLWAVLTIGLGTGIALTAVLIEPATAGAAFSE